MLYTWEITKTSRFKKLEDLLSRYPILTDAIRPQLHDLVENNELWNTGPQRTEYGYLPTKLVERLRQIIAEYESRQRQAYPEEFLKDPYKYLEKHFKETTKGKAYLTIVNHKTGRNLGLTYEALQFIAEKKKPLSIWTLKRELAPLFIGSSIFVRSAWWYNRGNKSRLYLIYDIDTKKPLTPAKARIIGDKLYSFLRNELGVHASVYFSGRGLHVYLIINADKDTSDEAEDNLTSKSMLIYSQVRNWLETYDLAIDIELNSPNRLIRLPGSINPRSGYKVQLVSGPYGRYYDPYRYHGPMDIKKSKKTNNSLKNTYFHGRKKGDPSFWVDTTDLESRFSKNLLTRKQLSILTDKNAYNINTVINLVRAEVFKRLDKPIFFSGEFFSINKDNPLLDRPNSAQQRKIISRFKKILNANSIHKLTQKQAFYLLHMLTAQVLLEDILREKHNAKQYKISDPIILLSRLVPVPIGMRHNIIFSSFNYMRFMNGKGPVELARYYLLEQEKINDEDNFRGYYNYLINKTAAKLNAKTTKATISFAYYFPLYMEFIRFVARLDEALAALLSPVSSRNAYTKAVISKEDVITVDQVIKMSSGKLVKSNSIAITNNDDLVRGVQYFIGARFGKAYKIKYHSLFNFKLAQSILEESFKKMFDLFEFEGLGSVIPRFERLRYLRDFKHFAILLVTLSKKGEHTPNWSSDNQEQGTEKLPHSPPDLSKQDPIVSKFAHLLPWLMTTDYEELARVALHN